MSTLRLAVAIILLIFGVNFAAEPNFWVSLLGGALLGAFVCVIT